MRLITEAADRLLALVVPKQKAHANRYYCVRRKTGCGYYCGYFKLYQSYQQCCYDDYTGQLAWCDDYEYTCDLCG